jgi:2-succinyl-6-hydroxy-2,4-cyclohexadiene-1-carboxylate synthase
MAAMTTLATAAEGDGRRIVLVHGFTQTRDCWSVPDPGRGIDLTAALALDFEVVRVDAPGHGGSRDIAASVEDSAALLAELGPAVFVGYSMGARLALRCALDAPDAVRGLVLIGATAGIEDDAARAERIAADEVLAERILSIGVDPFLDEWLAQPMFAGLPSDAVCLGARRTNTAEGLATSLRLAGTGAMEPMWGRLAELTCPVLAITGQRDPRFGALAERIVSSTSGPSIHEVIPGAGHTAHLEQPAIVAGVLRRWLASLGQGGDQPS